MQMCSIW